MTDMCKSDPSCTLCLAGVSHNFCFVQCQNFHSPSFSSVWPTGEELIFIPSISKKTLAYILILFFTKMIICVPAAFSFQVNWCFCCRNSNWKRGFYSSALLCCKKKIENAGFPLLCVNPVAKKTCPQVEMSCTLRFPPWEFTIIRRDVAKKPIFTTTWIFRFHQKCNRESAFRELSLSLK